MENFFIELKNKARSLKLSQSEKQSMRVRLYTYAEQNPVVPFTAPVKAARPVKSPFFFFSPRFAVPVVLLLIIGLSGGTAFAAQSALPGDPLYAVKINVNERVATALATTPAAKAQVNADLATTRLEEAESLASTGKLDATTSAELASNFTEHASAAVSETNDVNENDPGEAAQLGAEFDSTLAAHGAILAQIGDNSSSTETVAGSNALVVAVQDAQQTDGSNGGNTNGTPIPAIAVSAMATSSVAINNGPRMRTFAARIPGTSTGSTTLATSSNATSTATSSGNENIKEDARDAQIAASLETEASSSLAATQADFAAIQSSLSASVSAEITSQLSQANQLFASSEIQLQANQNTEAASGFTRALRVSVRLDDYIKAGQKFNINIISNLLGNVPQTQNGRGQNRHTNQNGSAGSPNGQSGTTSVTASTSLEASTSPSDEQNNGQNNNSGGNDGVKGSSSDDNGSVQIQLHI